MSHYITDDFDIMPMHKHVFIKYFLTEQEEKVIYDNNDDPTKTKMLMPESTYFVIRYYDKIGDKVDVPMKLKDPYTMTIK